VRLRREGGRKLQRQCLGRRVARLSPKRDNLQRGSRRTRGRGALKNARCAKRIEPPYPQPSEELAKLSQRKKCRCIEHNQTRSLAGLIASVGAMMARLGKPTEALEPKVSPAVDPKRTVQPNYTVSLEDGSPTSRSSHTWLSEVSPVIRTTPRGAPELTGAKG
jgi:hypothetical protein